MMQLHFTYRERIILCGCGLWDGYIRLCGCYDLISLVPRPIPSFSIFQASVKHMAENLGILNIVQHAYVHKESIRVTLYPYEPS